MAAGDVFCVREQDNKFYIGIRYGKLITETIWPDGEKKELYFSDKKTAQTCVKTLNADYGTIYRIANGKPEEMPEGKAQEMLDMILDYMR